MKTRLCIALTALAVTVVAGGWLLGDAPKSDDPPKVKGHLPVHFKKLGLSEKQIQDIYKIENNYQDKIQALQQQIDDLRKAEHSEVDGVLTDDQKTRLKELLTAEVSDKPPPAGDKDKPAPPTDKDKPAPPTTDKDKPVPATDKDKTTPPPAKDK